VARFARRGPVVRSVRRATEWLGSVNSTTFTALAAATKTLDQFFADLGEPATLVRTRGELWVWNDQLAASEIPFGALGMAIVSEQARVAGAAALPGPTTNNDSDLWFLHQYWASRMTFGSAIGFQESSAAAHVSFDSKAMRRIEQGSNIVVMMENSSALHGCQFLLQFRVLIKLHG